MPSEEAIVSSNHDFLVTETTIKSKISVEQICSILKHRRTTGSLIFHFIEGGICRILLTEKTKASETQAGRMRDILGMK